MLWLANKRFRLEMLFLKQLGVAMDLCLAKIRSQLL